MIIVIPSGNRENLESCISSLLSNDSNADDVIVVDDGCGRVDGVHTAEGEKPFIFSRNVNVGARWALVTKESLVIMCDDVVLKTPNGLSILENSSDGYAVVSPSIDGECGNDNQRNHGRIGVAPENKELCFMCVLIKYEALEKVGFLDERFVGYGYEDVDYSRRVLQAGLKLGVLDSVVAEHKGHSVFRSREDFGELSEGNKKIYLEKWGSL